ncbi:type I restriction endonuclease [Propionimicrobium sp. PCR01-08-3]|uniref:type I restriction endonuclease n=1 Tax=Propionimicrobium sp. PCR01-08-3 TaxID=3052086 RepID=UPI00255D0494|nr:type I restriction endonuclease [Propionimicrobium sp. PCR01-08-3]WIY83479.1 type I restriction enzyme HsdR N-terminal domain-containing protein [Propionimicrobium sp. PCR01-08-3]
MEFEDALEDIASKLADYGDSLTTEEATKNAIIMPFISRVFGYDVFNPKEVMPEFTADIGTKKGEKIDYAILHDSDVQMLIECKKAGEELKLNNASQLFRYFHVSNARIGVLTNGCVWQFFTDLDHPNKMDERPFLVLDLRNIDAYALPELKKLTKDAFDLESVLTAAEELKYVSSIKRVIGGLFEDPSEDFVRLLVTQVYDGSLTAKMREFFTPVVRKAIKQFTNDSVNARLKTALQDQAPAVAAAAPVDDAQVTVPEKRTDGVDTTVEELEGFQIVRAIVASEINWDRVVSRDTKSYFGVLVDDTNRKQICRLHFNHAQKYLGLLDENKNETRIPISEVGDIYNHADVLRDAARRFA